MARPLAMLALLASAAALVPVAAAQDTSDLFNRAPKSVDDALRARIGEFYQDHVDGEFRKAEALVAEDTKDFFYNHDKPRYLGFEIVRIEYSDGYTRAKATILVQQRIMLPGFAGQVMKIPTPSYWKLEDAKWCWYVDQAKLNETPFGVMKPGPPAKNDTSPEAVIASLPTDLDQLMNLIQADKTALVLTAGDSGQVAIDNGMKGPVTVSIQGKLQGVEASFDRETIPAGEKATLTVKAAAAAQSGALTVHVMPIGKVIPIKVTVK